MSSFRFTVNLNTQPNEITSQRPSTSNSLSKKVRPLSGSSFRTRQIIVVNQNSLNNLIRERTGTDKPLYSKIALNQSKKTFPNESLLVKKPFKHFVSNKPTTNPQTPPNDLNPSSNLMLKTAQVVNNFVDYYDKNQFAIVNNRVLTRRPSHYSSYSGLKPLNCVVQSGPIVENCMGIIKEPKGKSTVHLKDIYERKLKLLAQHTEMQKQSILYGGYHKHNNFMSSSMRSLNG